MLSSSSSSSSFCTSSPDQDSVNKRAIASKLFSSGQIGNVPIGGDYCGISSTFDPIDGTIIPIPEYLIPTELLDWGQVPTSLETIVSEDPLTVCSGRTLNDKQWTRHVTTVYPAVGCAVDNMETKSIIESVETEYIWQHYYSATSDDWKLTCQQSWQVMRRRSSTNSNNYVSVETIFGWNRNLPDHRIRVTLILEIKSTGVNEKYQDDERSSAKFEKPITIVLERQCSTTSTNGTTVVGGGVNGQMITNMLGPILNKHRNFAEKQPNQIWSQHDGTVLLPGNVTVALKKHIDNKKYILEVGYITSDDQESKPKIYQRQLVRRTFSTDESPSVTSTHVIESLEEYVDV